MPLLVITAIGIASAVVALIIRRRASRGLREMIDPRDEARDPSDAVAILGGLSEQQAEMHVARLNDGGIPAYVSGIRTEFGRFSNDVCVAAADADRALALLGIGDA